MGKRLGAFLVANIAIFVYALVSQPKYISDMGATSSLAEAFGYLLAFNILAVGVWVIVLLIRKVSRND